MSRSKQNRSKARSTATRRPAGWTVAVDGLSPARLFWLIVAATFVVRVGANLAFAAAHGRYASINPEIWFYHAVAEGQHPDIYRLLALDPTLWILRLVGTVFSGDTLLSAILVIGSLSMAIASGAVGGATRALSGSNRAGLAAALIYLTASWPYGASLSGFTHDTLGMSIVAAAFWCAVVVLDGARPPRVRLVAALVMGACWFFGAFIGPSIAAVIVATALAAACAGLCQVLPARLPVAAGCGVLLLAIALGLMWGAVQPDADGKTWVSGAWQGLADAASAQRGIDLALQSRQGSADVQPGHPLSLIHAYSVGLAVLAVAGAVFSVRRRRLLLPAFLCVSIVSFLVAHRGARLLDVAVAVGATTALVEIARIYGRRRTMLYGLAAVLLVAGLVHGVPTSAPTLISAGVGVALLVLAVTGPVSAWSLAALLAAAVVMVVGTHRATEKVIAVGDAHVRVLRAVRELEPDVTADAILPASWDLGYMVGAVSGCRPAAHPQLINAASRGESGENDGKVFWSPELAAAGEAERRGIRFVYIGERDFSIVEEYADVDQFRSRRRRGVQVPTISADGAKGPLPLSIVRQVLLYRMLTGGDRLSNWRLVAEEVERTTGERVRVFEIKKPPEAGRTYVMGILHNTTGAIVESELQMRLERDGTIIKQGAKLKTRIAPRGSSMAMFSFIGLEKGRGAIDISNPQVEVRLLARLTDGDYEVDMVRPERGWRPLASE